MFLKIIIIHNCCSITVISYTAVKILDSPVTHKKAATGSTQKLWWKVWQSIDRMSADCRFCM